MYHFLVRHEKKIVAITRALVLLALVTPLVFFSDAFIFPFITAKVFFFRSVVVLAFGGYLLLLGINPRTYRPPRSLLLGAVGVFFLWAAVASVFGVDTYHSVWSDHERMLGLFTMAHYILFLLVLIALFREEKEWKRLFMVFIGVGAVVLLGALGQEIDPTFLFGGTRAASTLGNPTYLSVYAMYVFFISIYLYGAYYRGEWRRGAPYLLFLVMALALGAFVWSETRGAFVGFGVALMWMCVASVFISPHRRERWIALGALMVILAGSFFVVFGAERGRFLDTPVLRRFADFSISGTNETRLRTWGIALRAWREHPLVGWGWLNFASAYDKYYVPKQLKHGLAETWVDQAHNTPVEMLTTTGAPGALLYLMMWGVAFFTLVAGYRRGTVSRREFLIMSGLVVFHFVQNIFVFDNPTSYLTLFMLFGWIITHHTVPPLGMERLSAWLTPRRVGRGAAIVVIGAVLAVYYGNVVPARANNLQVQGEQALQQRGDASVWWGFHEQALALATPHRDEIRREMVRTFLNTPGILNLPADGLNQVTVFLANEMEKTVRLHPVNARIALEYGELLMFEHDHLKDKHPDAAAEADRIYERAMALSPKRQQVGLLRASAVLATSDFEHVRTLLLHTRALSPSIPLIHRLLAEYFEQVGLHEDALSSYEAAIRLVGTPEQTFSSLDEWQRFGLLHIEYGNTLRGAWALDTVMSCATGRVSWRACIESPAPEFASFAPSRKAFAALILYYDKAHDAVKRDFYASLVKEYYKDFELPES